MADRIGREMRVAVVLLGVLVTLAVLAPGFYDRGPLLSLAAREAPVLVVAAGMALVIVAREIDISVGSQFSVCSVLAGVLVASGWPMLAAAVNALGVMLALAPAITGAVSW